MPSIQEMIAAIRNDKVVGRGSCSSIDECWSDEELEEQLAFGGITMEKAAVKWAREQEGMFLEDGLNQRWGEDDDPQLEAYDKFQEMEKEYPSN